jgi:hypothetical protein
MRHARTTTVFLLAATLAGCGEDKPTAAETKAAKARWVQHVDAACRKASTAIAGRGYPVDLIDLDRLVVRAIQDVETAIATIAREPLPAGGDRHPAAFVHELRALEPELKKLSGASEDVKPGGLIAAADGLKPRLVRIQDEAEKSGVRSCLTQDARYVVPAAVRAPVFAEQLNRLEAHQLRRIRDIGFRHVSTPAEYGRALERFAGLIARSLDGIDRLDPPLWAVDQTANYQYALRSLQSVVEEFAAQIERDRGKPPEQIDPATYKRLLRKLRVAGRGEAKAHRKMLRAVGAAPTTPPSGGDEAVEPETAEESRPASRASSRWSSPRSWRRAAASRASATGRARPTRRASVR